MAIEARIDVARGGVGAGQGTFCWVARVAASSLFFRAFVTWC